MAKQDNLETDGELIDKTLYEYEGQQFEFRVYLLGNQYVGRVYLNNKQYNLSDYVQDYDEAMTQTIEREDFCQRFFRNMKNDLKSSNNH